MDYLFFPIFLMLQGKRLNYLGDTHAPEVRNRGQ